MTEACPGRPLSIEDPPVTRPWQRAVTWLPAPLRRRIYVDQLRFAPSELEGLVFKLAETRNERDQAFSVVHDAYARRGIIAPHPSGWFATPFSFLPTTATVVAKAGDRVIGTVSLVEDSPCGLPLEAAYPGTVDTYRRRSRRVAEVSSLAVTPGLRGRGVPFMLYYLMFRWAYRYRYLDDLVMTVHPRMGDFFRTVLLFDQVGPERDLPGLKQAPAVALRQDLRAIAGTFSRVHRPRRSPGSGFDLFSFFAGCDFHEQIRFPDLLGTEVAEVPRWDESDVVYFVRHGALDWEQLAPEIRAYLQARYPGIRPTSTVFPAKERHPGEGRGQDPGSGMTLGTAT